MKTRGSFFPGRVALAFLALLLGAGAARLAFNLHGASTLAAATQTGLQRTVLVAQPKPGELQRTVLLPTTLRGATEAAIHARTGGYLAAWHKDIGDRVRKGELLATIDAPELEQELAQGEATRLQIQARLDLARQTVARWESLRDHAALSKQALEEKRSDARQAEADLAAATANVRRLERLASFRRIVAPFDGVITRRGAEIGDLIAPGGRELFAMAQTDPLRLTIWIPQAYATDVKIGDVVTVTLGPGVTPGLNAAVERLAGGIDARTRARQVDLALANPEGTLMPGAYAEVAMTLSGGAHALVVPASVLLPGDEVVRVAVVDSGSRIAFQEVRLGRDLGREVEILAGISPQDTLVVSPSDQLVEGEQVRTRPLEGTTDRPSRAARR